MSAITYHTHIDESDKFRESFKRDSVYYSGVRISGCFDAYWGEHYDGKMLYAFPSHYSWVLDLIKNLNKSYKNVQWHVEDVCEVSALKGKGVRVLLSNKFSEEYSIRSRNRLGYLTHHMIRMTSLSESWYREIPTEIEDPGVDFLAKLNNKTEHKYRALFEAYAGPLTAEILLNIDNPRAVNLGVEYGLGKKQTSTLENTTLVLEQGGAPLIIPFPEENPQGKYSLWPSYCASKDHILRDTYLSRNPKIGSRFSFYQIIDQLTQHDFPYEIRFLEEM